MLTFISQSCVVFAFSSYLTKKIDNNSMIKKNDILHIIFSIFGNICGLSYIFVQTSIFGVEMFTAFNIMNILYYISYIFISCYYVYSIFIWDRYKHSKIQEN